MPTRKTTPVVCSTADGPNYPIAHVLSRHGYRDRYALTAAAVAVHGTLRVARIFARSKYVEVQNYMKNEGCFSFPPCHTLIASGFDIPLALIEVWGSSGMLIRYERRRREGTKGVRRSKKTMPQGDIRPAV